MWPSQIETAREKDHNTIKQCGLNEVLYYWALYTITFGVDEATIRKQKNRGEYREGRHYVGVTNRHSERKGSQYDKTMWTKKGIVRLPSQIVTVIEVTLIKQCVAAAAKLDNDHLMVVIDRLEELEAGKRPTNYAESLRDLAKDATQ